GRGHRGQTYICRNQFGAAPARRARGRSVRAGLGRAGGAACASGAEPDTAAGGGVATARARSTAQIADELGLSRQTVRNHVGRLLRALGASSRLEAVAIARRAR